MPLPKERIDTIEDIYNLPDGERAELIDGNMYRMAPPSRRHQAIAGERFTSIHNYLKRKNGSCIPYIAPFAVICDPNKLSDRGCEGAPDFQGPESL